MAALYTPSTYTIGTVVLFWSALMVVVCVHELGHGFTCKYFGGQVHELGAMLIYFQPAFYCNVNDAWTLPDLRARLWVAAVTHSRARRSVTSTTRGPFRTCARGCG